MKATTNKKPITTKMVIAFHEAGHAVVSFLLGRRFIDIIIKSKESTDPFVIENIETLKKYQPDETFQDYVGKTSYPGISEEMNEYLSNPNINKSCLIEIYYLHLKKCILCSLAGKLAHERLTRDANHVTSQDDMENVKKYARDLCLGSDDEIHATIKTLETECKKMIKANWKAVEALAQELLIKNKIEYKKACKIIKQALDNSQ